MIEEGKVKDQGRSHFQDTSVGLQFCVWRIFPYLKKGRYAHSVGANSPVYVAYVLEYLVTEVLELAGNAVSDTSRLRITTSHIILTVKNDAKLSKLLANVTIDDGGAFRNINPMLLPKRTAHKAIKKPKSSHKVERSHKNAMKIDDIVAKFLTGGVLPNINRMIHRALKKSKSPFKAKKSP